MKTISTLTLVCVTVWLHAQIPPPLLWQKSLGGSFIDETRSICKNYSNGFMLAGFSLSSDGNINVPKTGNGWIAALDSSATVLWQMFVDADLQTINKTTDSNYFMAGSKMVYHATTQSVSYDFFLMKTDTSGNILWQKTYGGSAIDYAKSACATSDGGFIITGFSQSNDDDVTKHYGSNGLPDFWVVKVDQDGNLQWQKTLGGDDYDDAFSIQQTNDKGYIIAGRTNSVNGDVTSKHLDNEFWLVKLNADGNITWQNTYGGSKSDIATQVVQADDGGYIATGYSASSDGDFTYNYGNTDIAVIKTDANGKLQWQKTDGGSGDEFSYGLTKTIKGNYMIAASSNSKDGDLKDAHYTNNNYWVLQLDKQGNITWQNTYGGNGDDAAYNIINTTGEDYLVAGNSFSTDGDVSNHYGSMWDDIWLMKLHTAYVPEPFSFTSFSASLDSANASISWTTANETNIQYYDVQRSTDNIQFNDITHITSLNQDTTNYRYTDSNAAASENKLFYYRIAAVFNQDSVVYSITDSIIIPHDSVPVDTLSLKALLAVQNEKNIDLSWKAQYDINTKYYSVERSTDSITFTEINKVDSKRSDTLENYFYSDNDIAETANSQVLYYRIAAVNDDNSIVYTNIDSVHLDSKEDSVQIPEPFAFISFHATKDNNNANLYWKTLHESNIKFYNVQRSMDGIIFSNINQTDGEHSEIAQEYTYTDINIISLTGKLYYRIAAVDDKDSVVYSNFDSVHIKIKEDSTPTSKPFAFKSFNTTKSHSNADLSWKTLYDANIKFYNIQRSQNGLVFVNIDQTHCKKSGDAQNYWYTDTNIISTTGKLFYRIAAVDNHDSIIYSSIEDINVQIQKPVTPAPPAFSINVFPNPVVDKLNIAITSYSGNLVTYITDIKGNLLSSQQTNIHSNGNVSVPFSGYNAGIYFVTVKSDSIMIKKKVVKQ